MLARRIARRAMCHDVAGDAAGTATGCMNTFGNIGGAICPLVFGYAVQWWGSWSTPLIVTAGVCALCGLLTLAVDPTRKLRTSEDTPLIALPRMQRGV